MVPRLRAAPCATLRARSRYQPVRAAGENTMGRQFETQRSCHANDDQLCLLPPGPRQGETQASPRVGATRQQGRRRLKRRQVLGLVRLPPPAGRGGFIRASNRPALSYPSLILARYPKAPHAAMKK